ncbi:MAG: hypothetical protein ACLQU3_17345 [Limisphaerales bacterium]
MVSTIAPAEVLDSGWAASSNGQSLDRRRLKIEFHFALERFAVLRYSMADWQRWNLRFTQTRLQMSYDQLAGFLPQPIQLLEIERQEAREAHQANQRCQTNHAKNPQDKLRPVVGKILLQKRSIRNAS